MIPFTDIQPRNDNTLREELIRDGLSGDFMLAGQFLMIDCSEDERPQVQKILDLHMGQPSIKEREMEAASLNLRSAFQVLRTWANEAQSVWDDWPNKTPAQKDANQREVIRRFGILCNRLADLLVHLRAR